MTMSSSASIFADRICDQMVRRVAHRDDRHYIVTQFRYADGDFVNVYVNIIDNRLQLSDYGTTFHKLRVASVTLGPHRKRLFDDICKHSRINETESILSRWVSASEEPERAFIEFVQGVIRVSNMEFLEGGRSRSFTKEKVDYLLHRSIETRRAVIRNWHHQSDVQADFPVDYRVNSNGPTRHLFVVSSAQKASTVGMVTAFLRDRQVDVPSMAIVDPFAKTLTGRTYRRMAEFVDEICTGVDGEEQRIVGFALAE